MPTESGYSNTKKQGRAVHKTLHPLGSSRVGQHVVTKMLVERQAIPVAITGVVQNSTDTLIRITVAGHGALVGDVVRFYSGALQGAELEVVTVEDVNNVIIRNIVGVPSVADTVKFMYYVTPKSDAEGNVNFSPGPTTYSYNNVTTVVAEDTANPANNRALPSLVTFYKDGVQVPVKEDTVTPANNDPLPVKLSGVTGDVIINAGDLSVSIESTNDSVALGDAVTGDKANVRQNGTTSLYELKVADDTVATELATLNAALAEGEIVASNSSTTPLGGGASFTGPAFEVVKYAAINVNVFADQNSATDGLKVQFSPDGTNWDHTHQTTYNAAAGGSGYIFNAEYRYARVVFTNGATPQGAFRLQTIVKKMPVKSSLYTLDQIVRGTMFAELVKASLTAKNPSGNYVSIDCTNGGNLKVSIEEVNGSTDFATETTLDDLKTSIESTINTDGSPSGNKGIVIGGVDGSGNFQAVSVNPAGELSVTFSSAGFAKESTLSALNNKFAADFGASSGAVRTAAQIGNATGAADFNAGVDGAQTLRVSANIKRNGNELSYNSGAADANTLRVMPASDNNLAKAADLGAVADAAVTNPASNASVIAALKGLLTLITASNVNTASRAMNSTVNFTAAGNITPPAGAKGFTIQNSSRSAGALRFAPGSGVASSSVGFLLEPGQSTSYQDGAPSVLSIGDVDSATLDGCVIWYV